MDERSGLFHPFLDRVIEWERLEREGATLKNVSDNMRTLSVLVAMYVAIGVMYRSENVGMYVASLIFGVWTFTYSVAAGIQAGALFLIATVEIVPAKLIRSTPEWVRESFALIFGLVSLLFMGSTAFIILAAIRVVSGRS